LGSNYKTKFKRVLLGICIIGVCALIPVVAVPSGSGRSKKLFHIKARRYAYDPPRIIVHKGDEVHIKLSSMDVIHGFFLEGYDIDAQIEPGKLGFKLRHPSQTEEFSEVNEIVFTAKKSGKYRYRCSHTCGTMHPFMQGELIVEPNYFFLAGMGSCVGVLLSVFILSCNQCVTKQLKTTQPLCDNHV